jgi:shikimate dehydrogenase
MSERYAVIGNPVAHSRSPWIHAEFARACAQDMEYGRIEAPVGGFARAVDSFRAGGGKGLNVTVPFKGEACRYATRLTARAEAAQAVNTLVLQEEVLGDTTDGVGLVRDLSVHVGMRLAGRHVLLLGAGGAAQGVVQALQESAIASLTIANRTDHKARTLAARFGCQASGYAELAGLSFDLIVNATSAGLAGEALELPQGLLRPGVLAYDMVYGRDTPFLAAARAAGAKASDGLGMLVEQAAESFFLWRGVRPETAPGLARLRAGA